MSTPLLRIETVAPADLESMRMWGKPAAIVNAFLKLREYVEAQNRQTPGVFDAKAMPPSSDSRALHATRAERFEPSSLGRGEGPQDAGAFELSDCLGRLAPFAEGDEVIGEIVFVDEQLGLARLAEVGSSGRALADSWWLSVSQSGAEREALWANVREGVWATARHSGGGRGELLAVFSAGAFARPELNLEGATIAGAADGLCLIGEAVDAR